jgi:hypothetical protein
MALCGGFGLRTGWQFAWLYLGGAALLFGFTAWVLPAPRMRLRLSPEGLAYGTLRRRYFFRWSDVAKFGVADFAGHRWVVFLLAPHYQGDKRERALNRSLHDERVRAINRGFGGFDRFLPDTYGMRAVALAELLESWRVRYGRPAE